MLERPQTTASTSAEDEGEQRVRRNELLGQSLRALFHFGVEVNAPYRGIDSLLDRLKLT